MSRHLALAAATGGSTTPSPVSGVIIGANPRIAMLRVLVERALVTGTVAWQWIRHGSRLVARTPRWVGHAVLGILGSDAGYEAAVSLVTGGARTVGKAVDVAIRGAGRTIAVATGAVAAMIAKAAPRMGGQLLEVHADAVDSAIRVYSTLQARMSDTGQRLERLAHGPVARAMTTRASAAASGLLALHVVTRGVIATKLLHAAPALARGIAWLTNPWMLLLGVGIVAMGAVSWQALRGGDMPAMTGPLTVSVQRDGSVIVTGLPDQLSKADKQQVAKDVTSQAVRQMEATVRRRTRTVRRTGSAG